MGAAPTTGAASPAALANSSPLRKAAQPVKSIPVLLPSATRSAKGTDLGVGSTHASSKGAAIRANPV